MVESIGASEMADFPQETKLPNNAIKTRVVPMELIVNLVGRGRLYGFMRKIRTRYFCWRHGLKYVHPLAFINPSSSVRADLVADEYAFVSFDCLIMNRVRIGRYSMLAPRVAIIGADHRYDQPGTPMFFTDRPSIPETVIEDDVWIGFATVVMQGVRIGRGAIVGANAVVTKNIPAFEIWGGVPAAKIRDRFPNAADREVHENMLDGEVVPPHFPSHL